MGRRKKVTGSNYISLLPSQALPLLALSLRKNRLCMFLLFFSYSRSSRVYRCMHIHTHHVLIDALTCSHRYETNGLRDRPLSLYLETLHHSGTSGTSSLLSKHTTITTTTTTNQYHWDFPCWKFNHGGAS